MHLPMAQLGTAPSRKNTASDVSLASLAVLSATTSSLRLARQIEAELLASQRAPAVIAESADWHLRGYLDALKLRIEKLRDARLITSTIWGPHVTALFDDFFELTSAWLNALATYRDAIHGNSSDPDDDRWDQDMSGFDWQRVIQGTDEGLFECELERLATLIRKFARRTGVAITELHELPQGVREVVDEYAEYREQRQLVAATHTPALPPGGG